MSEHVARICLNGHLITISLENFPDAASYCSKCGATGIDYCFNCNAEIEGQSSYFWGYTIPLFCHSCGKPYPWADKMTAVTETPQMKWVSWTSLLYWFLVIKRKLSAAFIRLRGHHWTRTEKLMLISFVAVLIIGIATLLSMWLIAWR